MRTILLSLVLLGLAAAADAQTATPGSKFGWVQPIDSVTAQAYTWKVYSDGATTGIILSPVTCVPAVPATSASCTVPIPAYTPGPHTVQITASNAAGESGKSGTLAFTMMAIPATPGTPSIQ